MEKYNAEWPDGTNPLQIELHCIRLGGKWTKNGKECGEGLFHHYREAQKLLWPNHDHHRWSDLFLRSVCENKICAFLGPRNCGKTFGAAKFALVDYWVAPEKTCILVSSTDVRGLELRVWGAIKDLFNQALARYPWLAGHPIDYLHTITTDSVDEEDRARVLKKGIICIPCLSGRTYVGLGKYVGIKQHRLRLISDECQLMENSFLDAMANLLGNPDFKALFMGNPINPDDPLGISAEPPGGWTNFPEPTKTTSWKTKFMNGIAVNFVGTDSPNFDYPNEKKPRYDYLSSPQSLEEIVAAWGKDSAMYYQQGVGVMKSGLLSRRVMTRDLCREHQAQERALWEGSFNRAPLKRIYALDAAYGGQGGDRCVGGWIEFGYDIEGRQIIRVRPPVIIPVSIKIKSMIPEDQIAHFIENDCHSFGIAPEDVFYDDTGRGTLGAAFARVFGGKVPTPIHFGGRPTTRPVRHDLFVLDPTGSKRLKRCDEHYYDFVSELWFSIRYVVESGQMRELPEDVMNECCSREFGVAGGNKLFVESKHDPKARERMRRSPDLADWLATAVEGARQRGFKIERLGAAEVEYDGQKSFDDLVLNHDKLWRSKQLSYN